jgi:hypothetical protein
MQKKHRYEKIEGNKLRFGIKYRLLLLYLLLLTSKRRGKKFMIAK